MCALSFRRECQPVSPACTPVAEKQQQTLVTHWLGPSKTPYARGAHKPTMTEHDRLTLRRAGCGPPLQSDSKTHPHALWTRQEALGAPQEGAALPRDDDAAVRGLCQGWTAPQGQVRNQNRYSQTSLCGIRFPRVT